jgi:tetratricopeptide (TPR) repeat protein
MKTVEQYFDQTQQLLEAGDFERVLEIARAGLELDGDDGALWEAQGIALSCLRRFNEATASLETASTMIPLSTFGQIALAACYVDSHHQESAQCIYEFLATESEIPTHLLADVACGLDQVGRVDLALEVCRAATHREPACDAAFFAMAHYMRKLDYPPLQVAAMIGQTFDLRPDCVIYRIDLALHWSGVGWMDEAYDLLTGVDACQLCQIHCPCRLRWMTTFFDSMSDAEYARACATRLRRVLHHHSNLG